VLEFTANGRVQLVWKKLDFVLHKQTKQVVTSRGVGEWVSEGIVVVLVFGQAVSAASDQSMVLGFPTKLIIQIVGVTIFVKASSYKASLGPVVVELQRPVRVDIDGVRPAKNRVPTVEFVFVFSQFRKRKDRNGNVRLPSIGALVNVALPGDPVGIRGSPIGAKAALAQSQTIVLITAGKSL